jgi:hypothetical protein
MMAHHAQREHVRAFGKDAWQFGAQKAQPLAQPQPRASNRKGRIWFGESIAKVIPECDFELGAGLARPRKASRQSRPASLRVRDRYGQMAKALRQSISRCVRNPM